jgi:hypothetical protein
VACVGYWAEHLPREAYLDEEEQTAVQVFRRQYADTSPNPATLDTGDEYDQFVDRIGVVRFRNGKLVETERGTGDDF